MNYDHFTSRAKLAVQNAMGKAVDLSHQQVTPTHLLFGLCNDESGVINKVFGLLEANIEDFKKKIIEELEKNPTVDGAGADRVYLTTDSSKALEQAKKLSEKDKHLFTSIEYILLGVSLLPSTNIITELHNLGARPDPLIKIIKENEMELVHKSGKLIFSGKIDNAYVIGEKFIFQLLQNRLQINLLEMR